MKYLSLMILTVLLFNVSASEISTEEFPYIKPISIERPAFIQSNTFIPKAQDDDKDGVTNKDDKCPNTKLGLSVNTQGCEVDTDEDGVIYAKDECPNTSKDFIVDGVGCPQTAILKVSFASAKAIILPKTFPEIETFAKFLQENKAYQVLIYGYTDNSGSTNHNIELSRHRAKAVMNALIDYGIKLTRLTAIGMGSKNPIADNTTPEGRAKNRRIELELLQ